VALDLFQVGRKVLVCIRQLVKCLGECFPGSAARYSHRFRGGYDLAVLLDKEGLAPMANPVQDRRTFPT
jgi:hypothetical protein